MVKIRLQRVGKKKAPFYHIVVADSRSPRDGKIIEQIGTYDPMQEPSVLKLDKEKVKQYMSLPNEECYMLLNFGSDNIGQYALKPNQEHDTALQLVKKWGM